jgi:hypothetical protein
MADFDSAGSGSNPDRGITFIKHHFLSKKGLHSLTFKCKSVNWAEASTTINSETERKKRDLGGYHIKF